MTAIVCLLVFPTPAFAADSWWVQVVPPRGSAADAVIAQHASLLLGQIDLSGAATAPERADAIRSFVNEHSIHRTDEEFYTYWHDMPVVMAMLTRHAASSPLSAPARRKPHLECSSRSAVMYHLARAAGIRARFVVVQPDIAVEKSHTILEVLDPADGTWTIQDPDLNIHWTFLNGQRAGVADLLAHPVYESFRPCRSRNDCGFDGSVDHIVPYLAMATVIDPEADAVPVFYNPHRIDGRTLFFYAANVRVFCALFEGGRRYEVTAVE